MLLHLKLQMNLHQFPSSQLYRFLLLHSSPRILSTYFPTFALPCTLPASGPQRTLLFVVKKGIRFVLNPSSLLRAKQNGDMWRKELGHSSWELCWSCMPRTLCSAESDPTQGCGTHSTALMDFCLLLRDGTETHCAITELDSTNICPGPMVFFCEINRALQGNAFSSQGKSTWPPALWVSTLSRLSNSKFNKLQEKHRRTDLLPFPVLTRESLTRWPNNMTLERHWNIQKSS